jgi:hypothetical protein
VRPLGSLANPTARRKLKIQTTPIIFTGYWSTGLINNSTHNPGSEAWVSSHVPSVNEAHSFVIAELLKIKHKDNNQVISRWDETSKQEAAALAVGYHAQA